LFMFIRFISGDVDERSHVAAGLFCAANKLRWEDDLPDYEFDALCELRDWFNLHLASPFDFLPETDRYARGVCWFKPTACEYLTRAWELTTILERNGVLIWTVKSRVPGYILYEDDAQVFAEPYHDVRRLF